MGVEVDRASKEGRTLALYSREANESNGDGGLKLHKNIHITLRSIVLSEQ